MFAWILISLCWVALFLLILHDVTKDDCNGSAVSIAAKKLGALAGWAMTKARKLPEALASYTFVAGKHLAGKHLAGKLLAGEHLANKRSTAARASR